MSRTWIGGAVLVLLAATACATSDDGGGTVSSGGATSTGPGIEAEVVRTGSNEESEPSPAGTLITGPAPADHFWIQAISEETRDLLAAEGETLADGTIRLSPAPGATQLVVARGDELMLVAGSGDADPETVVDRVFALEELPASWTFHEASASAAIAATFDPASDPPEALPEGASILAYTRPDGSATTAVRVPAPPESLAGLLIGLELRGGSVFTGAIAEDLPVTLLPDGASTIVVHDTLDRADRSDYVAAAEEAR